MAILRISALIEDNHQDFKGALAFGLLLTSLKVFLLAGGDVWAYVCVCASAMWVLKIFFYMWYPQNISLLVNFIVEVFILYR